jgi:hypothetical protein
MQQRQLKRWHLVAGGLLCLGLGFGVGHSDSTADDDTIRHQGSQIINLQDSLDTCVTGVKTRTTIPFPSGMLCMYDDNC